MNYKSGLTLIEVLIAIAVFALFSILVNSIIFNILRGVTKQEALKEVRSSGDYTLVQMSNKIKFALGLYVDPDPLLSQGCMPGTVYNEFKYINSDGNVETISMVERTVEGSDIFRIETGLDEPLSGSVVSVASSGVLEFECDQSSGFPLVTVRFTLEHKNNVESPDHPEEQASMDFRTKIYMRQ